VETVTLRPGDLDPQFTLYELDPSSEDTPPLADFGSAVRLIEARWLAPQAQPGKSAELLTSWEIVDPDRIGSVQPPTFKTDTVFFTHLLDENGTIVSQQDVLDAPSWAWQTGDVILQIHHLDLPVDLPAGVYHPLIGVYDRYTGTRLSLDNASGSPNENLFAAPDLSVVANS
jgi:hypothetical protein